MKGEITFNWCIICVADIAEMATVSLLISLTDAWICFSCQPHPHCDLQEESSYSKIFQAKLAHNKWVSVWSEKQPHFSTDFPNGQSAMLGMSLQHVTKKQIILDNNMQMATVFPPCTSSKDSKLFWDPIGWLDSNLYLKCEIFR